MFSQVSELGRPEYTHIESTRVKVSQVSDVWRSEHTHTHTHTQRERERERAHVFSEVTEAGRSEYTQT